ncbi:MAG: hypothetical protein E6J34_23065 [Chloroflexi bacterium]|nr:MAG: hypothetical protein E6J34_23065 [Chloroflexota bacterium]
MWPFDQNNQQTYQQYAQAYDTGDFGDLNHHQSLGHVQQFMQSAPPDIQQQVFQQHFSDMPYEQREAIAQQLPPQYGANPNDPFSLAQSFLRIGQDGQHHLLRGIFSHPLLLGGAVGLAALVAKHVLARHQKNAYGGQQQQQYGNNPGYQQEQYLQEEVNELRREEQELRRELDEERGQERHRHHGHRNDW